jgi:hypothetical protein
MRRKVLSDGHVALALRQLIDDLVDKAITMRLFFPVDGSIRGSVRSEIG